MLHSLSDILFSQYRRRVLGLLLLRPEQAYHVREIARMTATTAGTLHKELSKLAQAGILVSEKRGNQIAYSANRACPIYAELASIMRKTSGIADVLALALAPAASDISTAFIFGSVAQASEKMGSDIDLMIIGEIDFSDAVKILYSAQAELGREINPKVFNAKEWQAKVKRKDAFIKNVLAKPKIFLIGNEHDLA